MRQTLTISLPEKIKKDLDTVCRDEGIAKSDLIRKSLRDYLFLRQFRKLREKMVAKAENQGIYTDEDVFEKVS
jgi:metal-responsive CopG/Arc/MetJ family transcriptional regulator